MSCKILKFIFPTEKYSRRVVPSLDLIHEAVYRNDRSVETMCKLDDGREKDRDEDQETKNQSCDIGVEDLVGDKFPTKVRVDHIKNRQHMIVLFKKRIYEDNARYSEEAERNGKDVQPKSYLLEGFDQQTTERSASLFG